MKKIGIIAGLSFLAGAIFFALTFGFFQHNPDQDTLLSPSVADAQTLSSSNMSTGAGIMGKGFSFAPLVKMVRGAVVKVTSESIVERQMSPFEDDLLERFFNTPQRGQGGREKVSGMGTGFFISADGYILTNNHVVQNAIKVKITDINKKEYVAKKIGTDPKSDLALLKVEGNDHTFIQLGDSDKVEVGEWVLAIGNPLGQDLSVTSGIVSAKGREISGLEVDYQNFIQTDAAINQGNSGGPLIDMEGKAIGINSVILSTSGGNIGIGFSIPSNMAIKVIADLKKEGRVIRGYIGVSITEIADGDAKQFDLPMGGVLIMSVEDDGPGKQAGLQKYDLIIEIDGKPVKSSMEMRNIIAAHSPGDTAKVTILRDKSKKTFIVKVVETQESMKIQTDDGDGKVVDLGMTLTSNTPALARKYELGTATGIIIMEIEQGGVADEHGLKRGDVIIGVNRTRIENVIQFRKIMSGKSGSTVFITINREGQEYFIRFTVPE